jgi:anti-sigma-K factor RskA
MLDVWQAGGLGWWKGADGWQAGLAACSACMAVAAAGRLPHHRTSQQVPKVAQPARGRAQGGVMASCYSTVRGARQI